LKYEKKWETILKRKSKTNMGIFSKLEKYFTKNGSERKSTELYVGFPNREKVDLSKE
jgi:hypothetical protein